MSQDCEHDHYVVIRHKTHPNLVVDAGDFKVKMKKYDGSPQQIWKLMLAPVGRFFIVNHLNGNLLSLPRDATPGAKCTTYEAHRGLNEQWYINSDETIVSADRGLALDIYDGNYISGATLIGFTKHGHLNQQFTLTAYQVQRSVARSPAAYPDQRAVAGYPGQAGGAGASSYMWPS